MKRGALGVLFCLLLPALSAGGATVYVPWSKSKGEVKKSAAALDLSNGGTLWERTFKDAVNFVESQNEGVLVGCDNGSLYLLSPSDGSLIWRVELKKEVNVYVGSGDEGFLVAHDRETYWLVNPRGELVHQWKH